MKPNINTLLDLMRRLRDPEAGCPWDVQQDFSTIAPYTVEEAYEVTDAIERGDFADLKDELGDLLLQVVFHAQMARESGHFGFDDVVASICEKLIRRHPQVFAGEGVRTAQEQQQAWERVKETERRAADSASLMDGVPRGMAELQRAVKLQNRAARVGFDWPAPLPVMDKIDEELQELRDALDGGRAAEIESELGDLMFALVNLARKLEVDPAAALRAASGRFERRFRRVEAAAGNREALAAMSLDEMEALWQRAKAAESSDE